MKPDTMKEIIHAAAELFEQSPTDLIWPDRFKHLQDARNAIFYVAKVTGHTNEQISAYMSKRCFGTINAGANRCHDVMAMRKDYREKVQRLLYDFQDLDA